MGTLKIGDQEFQVAPATMLTYKRISLAGERWDKALAAVRSAAKDDTVAIKQNAAAALDALADALEEVLRKTTPALSREEVEDLIPATSLAVAGELFGHLWAAIGFDRTKDDRPGEAVRQ